MKSKAAVLREFNAPLSLEEINIPSLEAGEVLVKLEAAGVCGSDVHMWSGKDPRTPLPMILGHEGVGRVADVAGGKKYLTGEDVSTGDLTIWNRGVVCGDCYFCSRGEASLCPSRWAYGIHRSINERPYLVGCYSEYIVLDRKTELLKIDSGVDPAVLVSASCSGATTAHAFDIHSPSAGETVVIQGPGPIGIFAVAFAVHYGAERIIVIGGTEERLAICREMGATDVLSRHTMTKKERYEYIMENSGGRGADIVYECVGNKEVVEEGLSLLRRGGSLLTMGFGAPGGSVSIDCYNDLTIRNLAIQGVWVSDAGHLLKALKLVLEKENQFTGLVTHRVPLHEADKGIRAMEKREAIKAVLVFE